MLPYQGWWLEAKSYTNRENVPRTEEPETLEGAVAIRYDEISNYKIPTERFKNIKIEQVIEIETKINAKRNDMIYTDRWLKVEQVETYVPEKMKAVVRMWPNRKAKVERKRAYLK